MTFHNDLFLRACRRQHTERTPVWMMRQAGRYLPEYRAIRSRSDFMTMCKTPELAAEVTVQPVDLIGVDAAIVFSDILVIPEAMGMTWTIAESVGPRFPEPLRTEQQINDLRVSDPERSLRFVLDAISTAKQILAGRVPLIGFAGSPWTLAAYMIDGGGSASFRYAKAMMLDQPRSFDVLLKKIGESVRLFLEAQLAAGADAVQIFDSWGGILSPDQYRRFSLDPMFEIVSGLRRTGQPLIIFSRGANHSLGEISQIGAEVVGIDWTVDVAHARQMTEDRVAIQGNLDPATLYASPESIRNEVRSILRKYGGAHGHIFNLGHGVLPDVPVENVLAMVNAVKVESLAYH